MQQIAGEVKKAKIRIIRRSSPNAAAVAREVIEQVGKGRKVTLGEIVKKHGYAPSMARYPKKVTQTRAYQEVLDPFIRRLYVMRDRILKRMEDTVDQAKYEDAARSFSGVVEKIELLEGRATSRNANINLNIETGRKDWLDNILGKNV